MESLTPTGRGLTTIRNSREISIFLSLRCIFLNKKIPAQFNSGYSAPSKVELNFLFLNICYNGFIVNLVNSIEEFVLLIKTFEKKGYLIRNAFHEAFRIKYIFNLGGKLLLIAPFKSF